MLDTLPMLNTMPVKLQCIEDVMVWDAQMLEAAIVWLEKLSALRETHPTNQAPTNFGVFDASF